ncbi:drebrin-like protein [Nasonia vitripennis]|uniref:Drebrin-like protein n=1 Tax=Nasonia vitripennis TaxID=7425 RepID=A0A7M7G634_NASVI|nr:drebrin-like protein [Nasonia vitripennis]
MAINLTKNKDALVAAWQSVVDDKSPTNWAVYGYEGQTNNLKVVSTGKGGLEEMIEELNSGMIQYAFCRVIDMKTTLPKCLLINWQGEGAPIVRKGTCANHIRDIERLLKGAHITINARSDEEVEVDLIMDKLSRATASTYKFNEPRGENGERTGPVGTTYRRVVPAQEINASERDQFWQKEEIEEKQRLEQERARQEQNRRKLEEEVRKREEAESKVREQKITTREDITTRQRQAEQRAEEIKNLRNQNIAANDRNSDSDDEPKSRSDELRRQRSKEAQELIAQRTINARAIFERNSSAGQTRTPLIQHHKGNHVEAAKKAFEQSQLQQNKVKEPIKIENKSNTEIKPEKIQPVKQPEPQAPQPQPPQSQTPQSQAPQPPQPQVQPLPQPQPEPEPEPEPQQLKMQTPPQTQPQPITPQIQNDIQVKREESPPIKENSIVENNVLQYNEDIPLGNLEDAENELYGQLETGQYLYLDPNNQGMKARALYDYQAADDTEITFDPGDIITHIDAIDEGWWQGLAPDGTYGLFPANHVEVIDYGST